MPAKKTISLLVKMHAALCAILLIASVTAAAAGGLVKNASGAGEQAKTTAQTPGPSAGSSAKADSGYVIDSLDSAALQAVANQATNTLPSCSHSQNGGWVTDSTTLQVMRECMLMVPEEGWVLIRADASVGLLNEEYEAHFTIGIEGTPQTDTDRHVNVYKDLPGDGTDENVAISVLKPVTPGSHIFSFMARRILGTGSVMVWDPSLSVVFLPAAKKVCSASGDLFWPSYSGAFEPVRQCTMDIPEEGWVLIMADSSLGRINGEYEAEFSIGIDSTGGNPDFERWVNIYDDVWSDGTDKVMALSALQPIKAGTHTFNLLARHRNGAGMVLLHDPTLSVVFLPSKRMLCTDSGNFTWQTISGEPQVIRQCTLEMPVTNGLVLITADSTVANWNGEYEAQFGLEVDGGGEELVVNDRFVNIYNDPAGDGTDKNMALSMLKELGQGTHTFTLLGRRYGGSGTVALYDPSLSVVALVWQDDFPWPLFLPTIINGKP